MVMTGANKMKIEIHEYHNTLRLDDVVAVITDKQWLDLCKHAITDKALGRTMLDILGNDKLFTGEK